MPANPKKRKGGKTRQVRRSHRKEKAIMWVAAPGARFGNPEAQVLGDYLEYLKRKLRRAPKTEQIYDDTVREGPRSPFHKHLNWDDRTAAIQYRVTQIRHIVNHLETITVYRGKEVRVKGWFSVMRKSDGAQVYDDLHSVANNPFARKQIVEGAMREQKYWMERFEMYSELHLICTAVKTTEHKLRL